MYVNLQVQKLTQNNYKIMIQAWLRSHCIVYIYVTFVSFCLKNYSALIARKKMNTNFNAC